MCKRYKMIKKLAGDQLSRIERNCNTYCRSETSMTQLIGNMFTSSKHTALARCIEGYLEELSFRDLEDCQAHFEVKTTNCKSNNLFIDLMLTSPKAVVVIEAKTWSPLHNDLGTYEEKAKNIAYGRKVAKMTLSFNKMPEAELQGWKSLIMDELAEYFLDNATVSSEGGGSEFATNAHDLAAILAFSGYSSTDEAKANDNAKDKAHREVNAIAQIVNKSPNLYVRFAHENPWKVMQVINVNIENFSVNIGISINFITSEVVLDISNCGGIQHEIAGAIMRQNFKGEIRGLYVSSVFVKIPKPPALKDADLHYADILVDFISKVERK
jgi:hypothetical protein